MLMVILQRRFQLVWDYAREKGLSPTLFGLYINDLAMALNASGKGIKLNEDLIIALLL